VDQFVERFGALPEEQRGFFACRLISGFQQHDIQLLRDILLAADKGRSSRKRGCSEVASEGITPPPPNEIPINKYQRVILDGNGLTAAKEGG
jgi:hypothetical protein